MSVLSRVATTTALTAVLSAPAVAQVVQDEIIVTATRRAESIQEEAWATNITNEITRGVTFGTTLRSGSRSAFVQDSRFYGVTVRKNF